MLVARQLSRRDPQGPLPSRVSRERSPRTLPPDGGAFRFCRFSVKWTYSRMVGVAQLVERRTVAPNVVGSNPISHPNTPRVRPGHIGNRMYRLHR